MNNESVENTNINTTQTPAIKRKGRPVNPNCHKFIYLDAETKLVRKSGKPKKDKVYLKVEVESSVKVSEFNFETTKMYSKVEIKPESPVIPVVESAPAQV